MYPSPPKKIQPKQMFYKLTVTIYLRREQGYRIWRISPDGDDLCTLGRFFEN
jgi:hypothetical protein